MRFIFFGCFHKKQTSPRKDKKGEYVACLECGTRISWSWGDRCKLKPPRLTQPGVRSADAEFLRKVGVK
jgi:hypothetical protein